MYALLFHEYCLKVSSDCEMNYVVGKLITITYYTRLKRFRITMDGRLLRGLVVGVYDRYHTHTVLNSADSGYLYQAKLSGFEKQRETRF